MTNTPVSHDGKATVDVAAYAAKLVKPLDWMNPEQSWLRAETIFGVFMICDQPMFGKPWRSFSPMGWPTYSGDSAEEVRDKTDDHYRQRILAALDLTLLNEREALRAALRDIAAHEPTENHNNNLNDLIAVEAVRRARSAL